MQDLGFRQIVLFTHDRASDQTLDLFANNVIAELDRTAPAAFSRQSSAGQCQSGRSR